MVRIYTAHDGIVIVPRYARHEWQRASRAGELGLDCGLSPGAASASDTQAQSPQTEALVEQDLIVREWTSPTDGQKEIFFRNLSGIIAYVIEHKHPDWYLTLQLWTLFVKLDNWPVFFRAEQVPVFGAFLVRLSLGRAMEWVVCHALLMGAVVVGRLFGIRGTLQEYTPVLANGEAIKEE